MWRAANTPPASIRTAAVAVTVSFSYQHYLRAEKIGENGTASQTLCCMTRHCI